MAVSTGGIKGAPDIMDIMIRPCGSEDLKSVREVINESARAYEGVIPPDRWKDPYMPLGELVHEVGAGVRFWGFEQDGILVGVMGIQDVKDVTLVRHAYVRTSYRNMGVGGMLLSHIKALTARPMLVGTWRDAWWAVRFYEKHGFALVSGPEKDRLLMKYWDIPARQVETSVVLVDVRRLSG